MAFICPACGAVSHHPEDERQGYCGRCHAFVEEDRRLLALLSSSVQQGPWRPAIASQALTAETLYAAIEAVRKDTAGYPICPANGDKHLIHPKEYDQGWGVCWCGQLIITDQEKYDAAYPPITN